MFCYKCGQQATAGQACPACGAVQPAHSAPPPNQQQYAPQPPQQPYAQQPPQYGQQPPQGYAPPPPVYAPPKAPSPLGSELGSMFKGFLSANPLTAFENATQSKSIVGVIFLGAAALMALLAGLCFVFFYISVKFGALGSLGYAAEAGDIMKMILFTILVPGFAFLVPFLFNTLSKSRMTMQGVLAVSGLSLMPFIPLGLLGFIFALFAPSFAIALLTIGLCLSFFLSFMAVSHLGLTRNVNPWLVLLIMSAALVILLSVIPAPVWISTMEQFSSLF